MIPISLCLSQRHRLMNRSLTGLLTFVVFLLTLYLQAKLLPLTSLQQASQQQWVCSLFPSSPITSSAGWETCLCSLLHGLLSFPATSGSSATRVPSLPTAEPPPQRKYEHCCFRVMFLCEIWLLSLLKNMIYLSYFDVCLVIFLTFLAAANGFDCV